MPGIKVYSKGYEGLTYQLVVEINHRRKELADLKVRQAIAHAIDKDFVVKTIFLGYAKPSTGPVPQNDKQFYDADVPTYAFDLAKANALLDEAGYKRGDDGTRFQLKLLPAPYFNETKQFGDYLRQALAAVGIDAQIVNNDAAAHQKAVYTDHAFDLAVAPPVFRGDPAISTTILVKSGMPDGVPFSNQGGYANAELDALIAKAAETLDADSAHRLYKRFPEDGRRGPAADQRRRVGLHHRRARHVKNVSNNPRWAVSNWADTDLESDRRGGSIRVAGRPEVHEREHSLLLAAPADRRIPVLLDRRRRHLPPARGGAGRRRGCLCRCRSAAATRPDRRPAPALGARPVAAGAALRLSLGACPSRSRLFGHLLPPGPRRDPGTAAQHAAPDGQRDRAFLRSRLGARHRRRGAAGQFSRPAAVDRLAGALCRSRLLARPGADRDVRRPAALAAVGRHRNDRLGQDRASRGRSTSPAISSCRSRPRPHLSGALSAHDAGRHGRSLAAWISCWPPGHAASPRRRIVLRHVARNALLPLVTMLGLQSAAMLGGSVVIETCSPFPGSAGWRRRPSPARDTPLLLGIILVSAVLVIVVNLVVDMLYALLDPRVGAAERPA